MPGTLEFKRLRELIEREALNTLVGDEGMLRRIGTRGALLNIVDEFLPDLDAGERAWLEGMPKSQQEAIRAIIEDVGLSGDLELEIQFQPAYDYSIQVYDYDKTVVVRAHGPYTGQTSGREAFRSR
jgi:hypothetical protein